MTDTVSKNILAKYPEWHYKPFLFNLEEMDNPFQIYKEFFDAYTLPNIRAKLWDWLYNACHDEYAEAVNLLTLYRSCEKLIEASYLVYNTWEQEERHKDSIIHTMELFFGIFAHELKGQFSGIIQCCQYLQEKKDTDFHLRTIIAVGHQALNTLNNLITTTKYHSGELEIQVEIETFHFSTWANSILQPFDSAISQQEKNILLTLHPSLQNIAITADKAKLGQIVYNLVANALKFSHPNTNIAVNFHTESTTLITQVANQGNGIPADKLDILFKPYQQAEVGYGGTGLGLYICRLYTEAMGGKIVVQSEEKGTTTFTVHLPGCIPENL